MSIKLDCRTCKYSEEMRASPTDLQKALVCRFNPPQLMAVYTQQGVQVSSIRPPLAPGEWCFQYTLHPDRELDTLSNIKLKDS